MEGFHSRNDTGMKLIETRLDAISIKRQNLDFRFFMVENDNFDTFLEDLKSKMGRQKEEVMRQIIRN